MPSNETATITTINGSHLLTLNAKGISKAWDLYMAGELNFDVYTEFTKLVSERIIGKTAKDKLK